MPDCGCEIDYDYDLKEQRNCSTINQCPLCAAAPALLEAANWAARSYHHPTCTFGKTGDGNNCCCHVGAAQAAIAKTTSQ